MAEALPKDVGRGIARIDPEEMEKLGVGIGGFVLLEGKRATPVKVMPTFAEQRGKGLVQIDGIIRENAKISIDEKVSLNPTEAQPARQLTLKALTSLKVVNQSGESRYVGRLVEGLPVTKGDKIRVTLFGSRTREFTVLNSSPEGVVVITPQTTTRVEEPREKGEKGEKAEAKTSVSYEDVGGLNREIQRVREMSLCASPFRYQISKISDIAPM